MAYLYQNVCHAQAIDVYSSMASFCAPLSRFDRPQFCVPSSTGYTVNTLRNNGSFKQESVTPTLITCEPNLLDYQEFSMLLAGILVAGFAISALRRVIR